MLYEIEQSYFPRRIVFLFALFVILLIAYLLFIKYIKKHECFGKSLLLKNFGKVIGSMLLAFAGIITVFCFIENTTYIYLYQTQQCSVVEGTVENFHYTYLNNSYHIDGISFEMQGQQFTIRKGIFNAGYDVGKNIITQEGEKLRIYYIDSGGKEVCTILRIECV